MKVFDCFKNIVSTALVLFSLNLVAENTINDKKKNILGNLNAPNTLIEYASLHVCTVQTFIIKNYQKLKKN